MSIAAGSAAKRRATSTKTVLLVSSSHWASSSPISTGVFWAYSVIRLRVASTTMNSSGVASSDIPKAPSKAWRCRVGKPLVSGRMGWRNWCRPENGMSVSACTPGRGQAAHLPLPRLLAGGHQQRGLADSGRPSYDESASDTLVSRLSMMSLSWASSRSRPYKRRPLAPTHDAFAGASPFALTSMATPLNQQRTGHLTDAVRGSTVLAPRLAHPGCDRSTLRRRADRRLKNVPGPVDAH